MIFGYMKNLAGANQKIIMFLIFNLEANVYYL